MARPSSPCLSKSEREARPNGVLREQLLSELPDRCLGTESPRLLFVGGVPRNSPSVSLGEIRRI